MNFATLPPEVNSGRMYAGPGSGPMLAAAAAWETLAAELHSTASSYGSVISALTGGPWLGPSSATMAAAGASYVAWMSGTAAQVEQTASQARAAAAAYEAAFAATVPPPEVAANRTQLMSLIATNLLGQNTPAIAATEAQYGEMWAQDAVAMYGYAGSSAEATQVTPFSPPQQNTNSGGEAAQANAVAQAGEVPAGSVSSATSALGVTSPLDLADLGADGIAYGLDAPMAPLSAVSLPIDLIGAQTGIHTDDIVSDWDAAGTMPAVAVQTTMPGAAPATANVVRPMVSAGVGEADAIGPLSVPPNWTAATPAVRPIALALPAAPAAGAPQAMAPGLGSSFGEMALAGTAGRAIRDSFGARGRPPGGADPVELRAVSAAAPSVKDEQAEPRTVVTGIAAEIRDMARLRDEGLISDEEYTDQRNRLLGR
ncbi:MAG: PPE domain-containing protein [Mycobacterium sp.]|uniref:PPE family protein, SVP subgroup n=1 Tax=Mycobacterium sp. TaxID=1785 RepID=UPI001ED1DEF4|nr:PPE domain-containing protein [Mycobacterium sp.]MBV8787470.1 PPE domain-containing protein [Mycobacterium sp.]